jgi:hypothetical protein
MVIVHQVGMSVFTRQSGHLLAGVMGSVVISAQFFLNGRKTKRIVGKRTPLRPRPLLKLQDDAFTF